MTTEQKAADILKAHRAAAKVAKARKLSPAFDAECAAAEAKAKANAEQAWREARLAEVSQWSTTKKVLYVIKTTLLWFWFNLKPALKFILTLVAAVVVGAAVGVAVMVGIGLLLGAMWVFAQPGRTYWRYYSRRGW